MSYDHLPEVIEFKQLQKDLIEVELKIQECGKRVIQAVCKFKVGQFVAWLKPHGRRKKPLLVEIKTRTIGRLDFKPCYKVQTVKAPNKPQKELAFGYGYLDENEFSDESEFFNG